jgi:hypothetical protein
MFNGPGLVTAMTMVQHLERDDKTMKLANEIQTAVKDMAERMGC